MAITTLEDKIHTRARRIYDAEHKFLEAQQTMLPKANSSDVKASLDKTHLLKPNSKLSISQKFSRFWD